MGYMSVVISEVSLHTAGRLEQHQKNDNISIELGISDSLSSPHKLHYVDSNALYYFKLPEKDLSQINVSIYNNNIGIIGSSHVVASRDGIISVRIISSDNVAYSVKFKVEFDPDKRFDVSGSKIYCQSLVQKIITYNSRKFWTFYATFLLILCSIQLHKLSYNHANNESMVLVPSFRDIGIFDGSTFISNYELESPSIPIPADGLVVKQNTCVAGSRSPAFQNSPLELRSLLVLHGNIYFMINQIYGLRYLI